MQTAPGPGVQSRTPASALLGLVGAVAAWSAGERIDEEAVAGLREHVLMANHARYVAAVPAYRAIAEDAGLSGRVRLRDISEQLIVGEGFLKGYDPTWLGRDFPSLTNWLDSVCTQSLRGLQIRATALSAWREELKADAGVAVTLSSGTTGVPSLVPRDRATLAALRTSGGLRLPWAGLTGPHDALLLVAAGYGTGLQSGASGLASAAQRHHFLTEPVGRASASGNAGESRPPSAQDYDRALTFAASSARDGRPLLVFGSPGAVVGLLDRLEDRVGRPHGRRAALALTPGSFVATGGGWKGLGSIALTDVWDRTEALLGVPASACVDTYSNAELNTLLVSCSVGRYHVPPSLEVVVLDELMRPQGDEKPGRLAFLDPFALSYPGFIATGDRAVVRRDSCPCGLQGATLDDPIVRLPGSVERGCGVASAPRG